MPVLNLIDCKYIKIHDKYLDIVWSNRCQILIFDNVKTNLKTSCDGCDGSSHLGLIQLIECCNALNNYKHKTRVRLHINCNYVNGKQLIDMIQQIKITIDELEIVTCDIEKNIEFIDLFRQAFYHLNMAMCAWFLLLMQIHN